VRERQKVLGIGVRLKAEKKQFDIFSQPRQEAVKGGSKGEWIATRTRAGFFHNPVRER
jgi:hypothetical protein